MSVPKLAVPYTVTLLVLLAATPSPAAPIVFDTSEGQFLSGTDNQGAWNTNLEVLDTSELYRVGFLYNEASLIPGLAEIRAFWTFDLRGLDLTNQYVAGATLRLQEGFTRTASPSETVGFYDVTTPAAEVNRQGRLPPADLFADLGTGALYATLEVPRSEPGTPLSLLEISLSNEALANISTAAGRDYFTIGARLMTFSNDIRSQYPLPLPNTYLEVALDAGVGRNLDPQQLIVDVVPVAEPASLTLLVSGLGALRLYARHRRRP